jgi:hypothetical protein
VRIYKRAQILLLSNEGYKDTEIGEGVGVVDTLRSKKTQILASDRPKPDPNGHCQDASTRSNLLPSDTGIAATCSVLCDPCPSQRQFGTLFILPLLARLVVSRIASGSSLRGFHRTRMIRHVDGYSYLQDDSITLTAAKAALSLFRPDLKDRGYQTPVIYVWQPLNECAKSLFNVD